MWVFIIITVVIVFLVLVFSTSKDPDNNKPNTQTDYNQNNELPDFAKKNPDTGSIDLDFSFEKSEVNDGVFLIVDVETSGLPKRRYAKPEDLDNWPRVLQAAWLLFDWEGYLITGDSFYIKQDEPIPWAATEVNNIDDELIQEKGENPAEVWKQFVEVARNCEYVVTHNKDFDIPIIEAELIRTGLRKQLFRKRKICTMKIGKDFCMIPKEYGRGFKYPKLEELFKELFFPNAGYFRMSGIHNAWVDVAITAKCFFKLMEEGYVEL